MLALTRNNRLFIICYAFVFFLGLTCLQYNLASKSKPSSSRKTESIQSEESYGEIPKQLFFTFEQNITTSKDLYNNVWNTIDSYRTVWGDPNATVHFLDDEQCAEAIERSVPSESKVLLNFYTSLKGPSKGGICRVAALYLYGGYYFDIDLQVIEPFVAPEDTDFVTVDHPPFGFFQAFIASTPHHPILKKNLEKLISLAKDEISIPSSFVGPEIMKMAYDDTPEQIQKSTMLLHEAQLDKGSLEGKEEYDIIARQDGEGPNCNWVVHDPNIKKVYFYSRMVGAGRQCDYKENSKAKQEDAEMDQVMAEEVFKLADIV